MHTRGGGPLIEVICGRPPIDVFRARHPAKCIEGRHSPKSFGRGPPINVILGLVPRTHRAASSLRPLSDQDQRAEHALSNRRLSPSYRHAVVSLEPRICQHSDTSRINRARLAQTGDLMVAYLAILATALAAFFGAPIWTAAVGAAALFGISYSESKQFAARISNDASSSIWKATALQSAGDATTAAAASYALGALCGSIGGL
jgi:hypothetical protein